MLCVLGEDGACKQASKQASTRARQVSTALVHLRMSKRDQGRPICLFCCCALVPTRLVEGPAAGRKCVGGGCMGI